MAYDRLQTRSWMDDPAIWDLINPGTSMMGGDAQSQATIEDMLMGTGQQYTPGGLDAGPMFPGGGDPIQDYIGQQLAGDVQELHPAGSDQSLEAIKRLLLGERMGQRGMQSIRMLGTGGSPHILQFPTGRPAGGR